MNARGLWTIVTSNLPNFQITIGLVISISTAITGWKTIQLNDKAGENNRQLARIERQLAEERFGFERIRDIYDRTERYLASTQDDRRGRALVVLVNSLPVSELRSQLLAVIVNEARSNSVAAKAADAVVKPEAAKTDSSSFFGKVVVEWISADEYRIILDEPVGFRDSKGVTWTVPAGAAISGTYIPRALWSTVGSPFGGRYTAAAIIHEYYTTVRTRPVDEVNGMFYEALIKSGIDAAQAKVMFETVSRFGPRWPTAGSKKG